MIVNILTDRSAGEAFHPPSIDEEIRRHSFNSFAEKATVRSGKLTLHPQPGVPQLQFTEPFRSSVMRPSCSPRLITSLRTPVPRSLDTVLTRRRPARIGLPAVRTTSVVSRLKSSESFLLCRFPSNKKRFYRALSLPRINTRWGKLK